MPVTPLARAIGGEMGARARLFERWDLAAALWQLDLASETVWIGDEGTTEVGDADDAQGDRARDALRDHAVAGRRPRADVHQVAVHHRPGTAAGWRWRRSGPGRAGSAAGTRSGRAWRAAACASTASAIAPRPTTARWWRRASRRSTCTLGYRRRRFDIAFDVENLFNGSFRAAQFATVSRLAGEPAVGAAVPAGFGCGNNARLATARRQRRRRVRPAART